MTGKRDKARGLFLAALMVLSVFAGTVALTGQVAASDENLNNAGASFDNNDGAASQTTELNATIIANESLQAGDTDFQQIQVDFDRASGFDGDFSDVTDSNVEIRVYEDNASLSSHNAKATYLQDASINTKSNGDRTITVQTSTQQSVDSDDVIRVTFTDNFQNPTSGGTFTGGITVEPQNSGSAVEADLTVAGEGAADTGPSYDDTWNTTDESAKNIRYVGQTLQFNPVPQDETAAGGANYTLYEYNHSDTNTAGNEQGSEAIVLSRNSEGNISVDTSGLSAGAYAIYTDTGEGNELILTNSTGFETQRISPTTINTQDGGVYLRTQDFSASYARDSVSQGQSTSLETDSNRRSYRVVVTSSDLSRSELGSIFADDQVGTTTDGVVVQVSQAEDTLNADFSGIDTGSYDFTFTVQDTGVSDTDSIEVTPPGQENAEFAETSYAEERGDFANVTLELQDTTRTIVTVGSSDVNYETNVRLDDDDEDGLVSFKLNTFLAGRTADESQAYIAGPGTSIGFVDRDTAQLSRPLDAAAYDLAAEAGGSETDLAVLELRPRSLEGASTSIAPSAIQTSDANRYTGANEVMDATTERRRVAKGDHAVIRVNGTGMEGYFNSTVNFSSSDNLNLSVRIADAGVNEPDPKRIPNTSDAISVVPDPDNDSYYIVIDTDATARQDGERLELNPGETYNVTLTLPASNPYIRTESNEETASARFAVVERRASFDTRDGEVVVQSAADQQISGTTTVAPGTEFDIRARKSGTDAFLKSNSTEVHDHGEGSVFHATFDFSDVPENTTFTVSAPGAGFAGDAQTPGRVAPRPTASVSISDQTSDGSTVVVDSVEMSDGGFVTIHDGSLLDGATFESVRGTSAYLGPGSYTDVEVTLDQPYEEDGTIIAMPHLDTNGNQQYDFVTSDGAEDAPYTTEGGDIVLDDASLTVQGPTASVSISDQSSDGTVVIVDSVQMSQGGFVTIHDGSLLDGATFESVRGSSSALSPGAHSDVRVVLDQPYEDDGTVIAMPHLDTNNNQQYDFVSSDGAEDAPYTTEGGDIVLDDASLTVEGAATPTATPTDTPEPMTETPTDTETATPTESSQPGFGLIVALLALIAAALIAVRRD